MGMAAGVWINRFSLIRSFGLTDYRQTDVYKGLLAFQP